MTPGGGKAQRLKVFTCTHPEMQSVEAQNTMRIFHMGKLELGEITVQFCKACRKFEDKADS